LNGKCQSFPGEWRQQRQTHCSSTSTPAPERRAGVCLPLSTANAGRWAWLQSTSSCDRRSTVRSPPPPLVGP
jgi:hypothetical protein